MFWIIKDRSPVPQDVVGVYAVICRAPEELVAPSTMVRLLLPTVILSVNGSNPTGAPLNPSVITT